MLNKALTWLALSFLKSLQDLEFKLVTQKFTKLELEIFSTKLKLIYDSTLECLLTSLIYQVPYEVFAPLIDSILLSCCFISSLPIFTTYSPSYIIFAI